MRLTEALLPLLRATAATSGRGDRRAPRLHRQRLQHRRTGLASGSGAYSASKFALAGWSDALYAEERAHGVHVGLVLPGFVRTEGFPASELLGEPAHALAGGRAHVVAEAILRGRPGGQPERYIPRPYRIPAMLRIVAPALVRRGTAGGRFTTKTGHRD